ncbi:MAG: hypothetical protein AB7E24_14680 [Novosphingobium sp.]
MKNLQALAQALAEIDVTDENAKIIELEATASELEAAIERGNARRSEIARILLEGARPEANDVADALLADPTNAAAAATAPDRSALESEKAALTDGVRELGFRLEDTRTEISCMRGAAISKARDAAQPLADEIMAEARSAMEALLPLYAAAIALSDATKTRVNGVDRMRDAISAARGVHGLLSNERSIDVPVDLIKALRPLSEKGAAMKDARFLQSVGMP